MSLVDVIVPCYNYARYLGECVNSVLTQDGVVVRVLILDDASQDNSEEVGRALAAAEPRVEYRRHAVNHGHIATYNEALDWIAGDYTVLVSADDLLIPGALKRACDFLNAHPEIGFGYGKVIRWRDNEPRPTHNPVTTAFQTRIIPGHEWIEIICKGNPPTTSPEVIVRTKFQKQLGKYRPELPHWADVELLMRFAAHAPVGHLDCYQAYYRLHGTNMNNSYRGLRDLEQRRTAFRSLFQHHGHLLPNAEPLKAAALRGVAERACWEASKAFNRNDVADCKCCLSFAQETYPPITTWSIFRRLRWKVAIGLRIWGFIRPVWRRFGLRPRPDPSDAYAGQSEC